MMLVVRPAERDTELEEVRALFEEYARSLGIDLRFQDFATELAGLPGAYAAPDGVLLIARDDERAVGCVAIRKFADGICEMKRLYVRPEARGRGVGTQLALDAIEFASAAKYDCIRLDTLETMTTAQRLYRELGFKEIPPYRHNPISGASFFELRLKFQ